MEDLQNELTHNETEYEESMIFALMHLDMIVKTAKGEYKAKPVDIDKRHAAVTAFIRTGQLIPENADRKLIESIREAIRAEIVESKTNVRESVNPDAPTAELTEPIEVINVQKTKESISSNQE